MESSQSLARRLSVPVKGSIAREAGRGVAWTSAQSVVNRGAQFLVFLVLARLLVPADFGTLAAANVFVSLTSVLADAGVSRTLVQRPELEPRHLNGAFLMSLISGALLTASLIAFAPLAARLYHIPALTHIMMALAVVPLVTAVSSTAQSVLRRQLRFRAIVLRNMASTVIGGAMGVAAALAGAGAWALVLLSVSQAVVAGVLVWVAAGWMPALRTDREALGEIFGFSNRVIGISLANFVQGRVPELLLGVFLGAGALGTYSVATRVQALLLDLSVSNVSKVALPVFSRMSEDTRRLASAYLRATRMTATVSFPFFAVMALTGPQLVPVLFGSQWERAGLVMSILALCGPLQSLTFFNSNVFLATGRAKLALRWSLATTTANLAAFAIGAQRGIVEVAIAITAVNYLAAPVGLTFVRRICGLRLREQLYAYSGALLGGAAMVLVVIAARALPVTEGTWWVVLTDTAAFVAYFAVIMTVRRELFSEVAGLMGRSRRGGKHVVGRDAQRPRSAAGAGR